MYPTRTTTTTGTLRLPTLPAKPDPHQSGAATPPTAAPEPHQLPARSAAPASSAGPEAGRASAWAAPQVAPAAGPWAHPAGAAAPAASAEPDAYRSPARAAVPAAAVPSEPEPYQAPAWAAVPAAAVPSEPEPYRSPAWAAVPAAAVPSEPEPYRSPAWAAVPAAVVAAEREAHQAPADGAAVHAHAGSGAEPRFREGAGGGAAPQAPTPLVAAPREAAAPAAPLLAAATSLTMAADPEAYPAPARPAGPQAVPVPVPVPVLSPPREGPDPVAGDADRSGAEPRSWEGAGGVAAPQTPTTPHVAAPREATDPEPPTTEHTHAHAHTHELAPHPTLRLRSHPDPEPEIPHPHEPSGIPGPGVAEIVAQAVARGLRTEPERGKAGDEDDTQDIPRLRPAGHGTAVTEVPVHLPFRGEPQPQPQPTRPIAPAPEPTPAPTPHRRTHPKPTPGRRVPRGDDRLREHRGPVLPGWVGVVVGGLALSGCTAVLWRAGILPAPLVAAFGGTPRAYQGLRAQHWPPLAFLGIVALLALGGLGRARTGHAWVLTLFGRYRGTVRRTGLTWISPLLLRRRVDVRLRHWRSDPMPAVDSGGLALQVVVQVVWQVKDTARATLAVEDHVDYLAEQVESAMARVLSQLPADAFHEDAPTLRDAEAVGDALTRMLAAETEAVGIEVYSAQPTRIEYAPEVAEAMRRRRVAAIDAKHRDTVLTSVVDAVDDTVHRLTSRGLVELDDYERKALVKDLTVAFYTGRAE
ncbi:SPFH domain-containing protein [Streptomyces sp. NPDC096339]|uniref:SPFH domain-containing protein n=1 Tax=Streptomyces sp. NPDC096339 TaxID=3366086 RepID=UPI0038131994